MPSQLSEAVTLPCGLTLPNRIAKAAMAENMAPDHGPEQKFYKLYSQWGKGGWGAILTGNVQVDLNHLGQPNDLAFVSHENGSIPEWKKYADACQEHGTPAIVQICHPGRQSFRGAGNRGLFSQTIAPSAVPLNIGDGWVNHFIRCLVFGSPREMTQADIDIVTQHFIDTAKLMADSGFAGIELHGAHGYLIDQFLNPKSNIRTDAYGGSAEKRAKFLLDILAGCRKVVPPNFCIGVKLNSADHGSSGFEDCMTQIGLLVEAGIDFLEISGGSYENPKMVGGDPGQQTQKSARTIAREAFFIEFAHEVRKRYPDLILMLTGGFRSRTGAEAAISSRACDLIGIGRPAAIYTDIPHKFLDESLPDNEAWFSLRKVELPWFAKWLRSPAIGGGAETEYYRKQIERLAKGLLAYAPGASQK